MERKITKKIAVGNIFIGGDAPVVVQSMCDTRTEDTAATIEQILQLQNEGCELIRVAVPHEQAVRALGAIKQKIQIPLVADIHFDYRLALIALEEGVDKLRINPGNIGSPERIEAVVRAAKDRNVPIRIGVNAGSLEREILEKYERPTAQAMVESALSHIRILEELDFFDILISVKASSVPMTIEAYRKLSQIVDYPLHLGITEAGPPSTGIIRSAVGMGSLLSDGIGDTLRVSLSADPREEVRVAWEILKSLELRKRGITLVSCPRCGRVKGDVYELARRAEEALRNYLGIPLTVAIMGCEVNGPLEAKHADLGLACVVDTALLFVKGEIVAKLSPPEYFRALLAKIDEVNKNAINQ